ncbi:MAG: S23 ribosomal protein [Parcubacteria group bacterium GW2011_GWE2_39_37]|uniref:S23 ribosomal protein n=1 Tax=Candidatus Falkowbacteria bacterium GW2011_GWF2_39_8 TaxID=1618642 RepID=A0A0G0SCU0_9BACT|nr:MAG: S23 ribosomal protein [Parcubacteria group bacterium GW2011_GWE2_39_37]KKR32560.1 MAG: S23 ribosomal protein [Candidatus Falkowbacteria bacterium GW2011_GWF2_39_8]
MNDFHQKLKTITNQYAHDVYRVTKSFPKDELFGVTSQLRRSALSVALNFIEGYARRKGADCKVYRNFLDIAYGSLKESVYLLEFALIENYISEENFKNLNILSDEIGAMLYKLRH